MPVLSGLIVSIDAFFIGLALGMQKKCKFLYLVVINACLLGLCILGYLLAGHIYEHIAFDTDYIVGFAFIALGLWCIINYFICEHVKRREGDADKKNASHTTIALVGLVMSVEAMLITMGLTFIFLPGATIIIPITVAFAHFVYSAFSFYIARTKQAKRIPTVISYMISGFALIIYGLMALFIEFGV